MRRRTFEEMITYFNQTVSEMDIDRKYKMTLLGIVTALLQKHDEDVAQIVRCKDCKHWREGTAFSYDARGDSNIATAPTIEERKKGKWINEGIYGEGHSERAIRCSNCDWHYIGYLDDYKFCPNCGADMRGEKDETD